MKPVPEMTRDEINRELCERFGYDAEIRCGKCYYRTHYGREPLSKSSREWTEIDFFSDPGKVMLLREMEKQKDKEDFYPILSCGGIETMIHYMLDEDGLLALTALEFLRKEQG